MSVTRWQPPASNATVVSRYAVPFASTNPTTHSTAPAPRRIPPRAFMPPRRPALAAPHARDKLNFLAAFLFRIAPAWRPFGSDPHTCASDPADWPPETQRPPRRIP